MPERPVGRADSGLTLTTLDGRYQVVERIAAGGMGEVFRAYDAVLAREVAIKVLHRNLAGDAGFIDRFRSEARAAAGLSHANIVAVHDWGSVDGIYYMVMEFVQGRSVRELLQPLGRLEPAQVADVVLQTLSALEHAHGQGIVHRDVKPENLMVNRKGVVKVADFGLARAYASGYITQAPGTVTGTVQYLAPEQIQGEPADPRTDLYSLGIVAFELLTGRVPFSGETSLAIAYRHLRERVPAPSAIVPQLPADLDGFVTSATERDREMRPESAAEMRRDLAAEAASLPRARSLAELVSDTPIVIEGDGSGTASVPGRAITVTIPRAETGKTRRKRRWRKGLGIVSAILALAAVAWAAWTYLIPHAVRIPSLVGTPMAAARGQLEAEGLTVKIGKGTYSLDVRAGAVAEVIPAPGTSVAKDARVTLIPSLGPQPIRVPRVEGLTVDAASARLTNAGFQVGASTKAFSDSISVGDLIRTRPPSTGTAPEGSAIKLVISKGPPPVPIPNVVGKSKDAASAELSAKGFTISVRTKYSKSVPRDYVIGQAPRTGTAPKGSAVTLTLSLGPKTFQLASYLGLTKDKAVAAIVADGLHARIEIVTGSVGDIVRGQNPKPGTTVHAGDTITIFVA